MREDFAVSAPAVVLGAAAAVTERIRLQRRHGAELR
jgi:alkanesulfonate monooxygenase SsuD/methylene tetrahydromethanopterin reductase-like flavin-dependent oxidoreductase (luciferase family)